MTAAPPVVADGATERAALIRDIPNEPRGFVRACDCRIRDALGSGKRTIVSLSLHCASLRPAGVCTLKGRKRFQNAINTLSCPPYFATVALTNALSARFPKTRRSFCGAGDGGFSRPDTAQHATHERRAAREVFAHAIDRLDQEQRQGGMQALRGCVWVGKGERRRGGGWGSVRNGTGTGIARSTRSGRCRCSIRITWIGAVRVPSAVPPFAFPLPPGPLPASVRPVGAVAPPPFRLGRGGGGGGPAPISSVRSRRNPAARLRPRQRAALWSRRTRVEPPHRLAVRIAASIRAFRSIAGRVGSPCRVHVPHTVGPSCIGSGSASGRSRALGTCRTGSPWRAWTLTRLSVVSPRTVRGRGRGFREAAAGAAAVRVQRRSGRGGTEIGSRG